MLRVFLYIGLLLVTASVSFGQGVVIKKGTELSVTNSDALNSGTIEVNGDANFQLSDDFLGPNGDIAKGSELIGRIVEVQKFDGGSGESRIILLFDFLKSGDNFYSIHSVLISGAGLPANLKFTESDVFSGGTIMSLKGGEISIEKGTVFKLKVLEDVVRD